MKFKKVVMGVMALCLLMATACENSDPIISGEKAKSIVLERHTGEYGAVEIISVRHKNNEYVVKWENDENCESGIDYVDDENGEIKRGQNTIC